MYPSFWPLEPRVPRPIQTVTVVAQVRAARATMLLLHISMRTEDMGKATVIVWVYAEPEAGGHHGCMS